jgi:para-nitrobenzyl esterase
MKARNSETEFRAPISTLSIIIIGLLAAIECSPGKASATRAIVTDQGPLKGFTTADNLQNAYVGIPYAAPPVGSLRWRPPQPPARFKGVFQATQFGNPCPQFDSFGNIIGSEDCLALNVQVPEATPPAHGFPVMVWIHGGGLLMGAGFFYDPSHLVEKGNVIVVTINYRLGLLGFFAHPALDTEGHLKANYGLMDQQFALDWVRRNIGAFGGDHKRVTIFGESAGGLSTYSNIASPTAAGLFQRAIAQSGASQLFQFYFNSILPLATAEGAGQSVATELGCNSQTAACLRGLSAAALVQAGPNTLFPIVDGTVLTQTLDSAFATGAFNRVPVMSGANHDEFRYFVALNELLGNSVLNLPEVPLLAADYPQAVYSFLGLPEAPPGNTFGNDVIADYPVNPSDLTSPSIQLAAIGTDIVFVCPTRNANLLLSKYVPTYAYEFHDETAPSIFPPVSFPTGDSHFVEVQYLFDVSRLGITPTFTQDQQDLSNTMIGYWTQFVTTGNPNLEGTPNWPAYIGAGGQFQSLVAPTPESDLDSSFDTDHKCSSLWNNPPPP